MIKFFRKIRQNMLTENKFSKYLLYAIGEIVLVVIGILIALSINNQNESRKNQNLISIYKSELVNDLLLDVSHFKNHLSLATEENKRIDSLKVILQKPNCNIDTLNNIIKNGLNFIRKEPYIMVASTEFPIISDNTFLSLQNSGQITLLENKLQEELVSFYGYTRKYSFMINEIIKNKNELYFDYVKSIPIKQSEYNIVDTKLYDKIWNNVDWSSVQIKFVTLLNTYYELNLKTIFFNDMRLYKTNIMIEQLKSDLKK
ncbi:DUF6090 family protein [Thalassobellus citreus]|uniref:DUF6090 family protein n=1 Tax=Thalassobellus citreus TaxID=3367752 RepID=UPI00379E8394